MTNTCSCCSGVSNIEFCEDNQSKQTSTTTVIQNTNQILPDDQLLIIRKNTDKIQVYRASFNDLSPEVALCILEGAVRVMPNTDPGDGQSLWLDCGTIRRASGNPADAGMVSPQLLKHSINALLANAPTTRPPEGGVWVDNGVLIFDPPHNKEGCC